MAGDEMIKITEFEPYNRLSQFLGLGLRVTFEIWQSGALEIRLLGLKCF